MKWFIGVGLLLLAALILESGLLAYAMYVLAALLILSRILARAWIGNLHAERTCKQTTAEIGDAITVRLKVRNSGMFVVPWVLLEDLLPASALRQRPPRLEVDGKRLQIRTIRGGQEISFRYELTCRMRGYYQIGPLVMESGDLFGLHRRYRVDADPHYLLVYPKVVTLAGYDLASRRPIGDIKMMHRLFEDPTRIAGVRPYETGDPLNRVHWRATARTGQLHCKIYEPSTLAGVTLLLDLHQADYPRRGEPHRSELAVTAAVSLANAVYEMGQQVGLISNGRDAADRIRLEGYEHDHRTRLAARSKAGMHERSERLQPLIVQTRRGAEQFQRIREIMARVELTDGLSLAALIYESTSRMPRDATIVALLPEASVETALALGSLRRQGYAVSIVLVSADEADVEDSYGRLMAEGIMDIRTLRDEAGLQDLCQRQVRGAGMYDLQVKL
jgi:uncharacterized protein (DUF58 family)